MDGELPEVVSLLRGSARRWESLHARGTEWRDDERSMRAFMRRRRPGGMVSVRGAPGPADRDPNWELWWRRPDRVRVEYGGAHGLRVRQITDGARTWMSLPSGESRIYSEGGRPQLGPAGLLVETGMLPDVLDLEITGRAAVLGRQTLTVGGVPRPDERPIGRPLFHPLVEGADQVLLAVDVERGLLLSLEAHLGGAAFYRVEMTSVAFDQDIPEETFRFPPEEEGSVARRPRPLHGGPPDDVLGAPVDVRTVLARTDSAAVAVDRAIAYPSGFELHVTVRTRDDQAWGTTEPTRPRTWGGSAAFPGESVRFGVVFSDGRQAYVENFREPRAEGVTLVPLSGSGTSGRFDQSFWVTPLPPAGALGLMVEWAPQGLAQTRVDVSADAIRIAAREAIVLWPGDPGVPSVEVEGNE